MENKRKKKDETYGLRLTTTASRQLDVLDPVVRAQILLRIYQLAVDPRPAIATLIDPDDEVYSMVLGGYRIVYWMQDATVVIVFIESEQQTKRTRHG